MKLEWYTMSSSHPPKIGAGTRMHLKGVKAMSGWEWAWHWRWKGLP